MLILDGGLASELEIAGLDLSGSLWSARLLLDNPDAIKRVHIDYLKAGADIILTSTYQAHPLNLARANKDARSVFSTAMRIAREAVAEVNSGAKIAASMGSYGAFLADGSEYRGFVVEDDVLIKFHLDRLRIVMKDRPDFLAFETIPCLQEARCISAALALCATETPVPAWVSFSCVAGTLSSGDSLEAAVSLVHGDRYLNYIGINCTDPHICLDLIKQIKAVPSAGGKGIVCYPNSGEVYDGEKKVWINSGNLSDIELYAELARSWKEAGAEIIGGCCRTGPAHIKRLKEVIASE